MYSESIRHHVLIVSTAATVKQKGFSKASSDQLSASRPYENFGVHECDSLSPLILCKVQEQVNKTINLAAVELPPLHALLLANTG
jgi:hypothetical protein